ncbi:MAG: hypothetical protein LBH06_04350 [Rikenellaceae bacterium]|jgi:hypothetical protein|nr:hypothetical protein [Rikenellaceae bacterium]
MKKMPMIAAALATAFAACHSPPVREEGNRLIPKGNLAPILDSFVQKYGAENTVFELYIDEVDNWNLKILLFAGNESLTISRAYYQQPQTYTVVRDRKIEIFSGVEHYFNRKDQIDTAYVRSYDICGRLNCKSHTPQGVMWIVTDNCSGMQVCEKDFKDNLYDDNYPFRLIPPPPVEIEKYEPPKRVKR